MTRHLRDYQRRAVDLITHKFTDGTRRICLVAPTGSGKTTMAAEIVRVHDGPTVWAAHRRELISQAAERLRADGLHVGVICPGASPDPSAPIQVGTVQTLLARDVRPPASLVVLDECHHYAAAAEEFASFSCAYPQARILGLTATPARRDGSPLGDVFDDLVVAATYSELIEQGHITPCIVNTWPESMDANGWAQDPITAYRNYGEDSIAVAFFDRVARATEWCGQFNDAGIRAAVLSDKTKRSVRDRILSDLESGKIRVCCNVNVLTEGTDIPPLRTCILARKFSHPSQYMQCVGRVLRPSDGKTNAILIDLPGVHARFGAPTDDRIYSLTGEAIAVSKSSGMRSCPACGYPFAYGAPACPRCAWVVPVAPPPTIKIWNVELRRVFAGKDTPAEHKRSEWDRLLRLSESRQWSIGFAMKEYRKLFSEEPDMSIVSPERRRAEFDRLRQTGADRGFRPGFAKVVYKQTFGNWPPANWSHSSGAFQVDPDPMVGDE